MPPPAKSPADDSPDRERRRDPPPGRDAAAEAERLQRELSARREQRARQDRARAFADGEAGHSRAPRPTTNPSMPTRRPDVVTERASERDASLARPRDEGSTTEPAVRPSARDVPRDGARDTQRAPVIDDELPVVDTVAVEVEELIRDLRARWRGWILADRITFVASLTTIVGTLMPWLSDRGHPYQIGITCGGAFHAAFGALAIRMLLKRDHGGGTTTLQPGRRSAGASSRRTSLWHLLLGASSTLLGTYLLVLFGLTRNTAPDLEVRFGLYLTLVAGMGLSYGGFTRFFGGDDR